MDSKGLPQGAWVVVADGEKALFLVNRGDDRDPNLQVVIERTQSNPPDREQGTDRPGRMSGGASTPTSAMEETDWHRLAKDRFAEDLARILYARAHAGRFEALAIIAAPHVLGELRSHLHKEVADRVIVEIPKTLTHHRVDQIEAAVQDALGD